MQNYIIQQSLKSSDWKQSYLAVDPADGRQILLKFIIHPTAGKSDWYGRFHDRLATIHKLLERQPTLSIAPIRAWGKLSEPYETPNQTIPADSPYYILDYIEGYTLASLFERQWKTSLPLAVEIVEQIAAVLEPIHAAGLAHGNLKPSNILLAADDRLMLTDFHLMPGGGYLMNVGEQLSLDEASYVSPEQTQTERAINPRSDIYNLGLIAFELATGQRPFRGQSVSRLLRQHAFDSPPSAQRINSDLPREIEPILQKALAKNDLARYGTASEMAAALRQLIPAPGTEEEGLSLDDLDAFTFPMPTVVPVTSMAPDPLTTVTWAEPEEEKMAGEQIELFSLADVKEAAKAARPPSAAASAARPSPAGEKPAKPSANKTGSNLTLIMLVMIFAGLAAAAACIFTLLGAIFVGGNSQPDGETALATAVAADDPLGSQQLGELLGSSLSEQLTSMEPGGPRALVELAQMGEGHVNQIALSPDGRTVAIAGQVGVKLYDGETLTPLAQLTDAPARAIGWLPDGRLALPFNSGGRSGVELYNLATDQIEAQLTANLPSTPIQIETADDGRQLATLFNNGDLHIWDIERGGLINQLNYGSDQARFIAWSPQDERLAVALSNRATLIINPANGEIIHTLEGSQFNLTDAVWSPDAAYLAGVTSSGRLVVWRTADARFMLEARSASAIGWTPDGRYLVGGDYEGHLNFWAVSEEGEFTESVTDSWQAHESAVEEMRWLADPPRLLSRSAEGWLRLHDAASGAILAERPGFSQATYHAVGEMGWSPDGRYLAASSWDSIVRVWDVETTTISATLHGHTSYINHIVWSPNGDWLATGALDRAGPLRLWPWQTDESIPIRYEWDEPVASLAFAPTGDWLAVGVREGALVLQPVPPRPDNTGTLSSEYHTADVTGVAWSPDGRYLLSASKDGQMAVWEMPDGGRVHSWQIEDNNFGVYVAWSPTEPVVATAVSFGSIQLWNSDDWSLIQTVEQTGASGVDQIAFSGDGRWLGVVGGRSKVTIFDAATGEVAYESHEHRATVRGISWSPTAPNRLATGGDDGIIRLWLLPEGEPGR